ncbi:MAG: ZIP family metal transporter [Paludibacteraceae bacterium]|nr:ZIP family metal transporter [Paludibacteraceae bacterium]
MYNVLISAAGLCGATIIGSILGLFIKELPHKWNDAVLGYCAGIMLAVSTIGLIVPAFQMSTATAGSHILNYGLLVASVMGGALFLNLLDFVTPHLHTITGLDPEEHKSNATLNHVLLFVLAIALHKLPEGMAAGITMCPTDSSPDWRVTLGISLQNIPEGMVIIVPLLLAGVSTVRTFFISLAIGLLEIIGVLIGYGLGSASESLLPILLGFAGGAMLYVTSDELIPETHAHGYQKQATYALLLGFMTLLLIPA